MNTVKNVVLTILVFLFPLFFLPITQEFFLTNKLYLMIVGALLLVVFSALELLTSKRPSWKSSPFDVSVLLVLVAFAVSVIISSPNKIEALLNINFGFAGIAALSLLFFYLARTNHEYNTSYYLRVFSVSSLIVGLITIVFFFQPFKNATLPSPLQFLQSPLFSPLGGRFEALAIFLGFGFVANLAQLISKNTKKAFALVSALVLAVALGLVIYSIFKSPLDAQQRLNFALPPYRISWYSAVEVLKNPQTALFGVGADNFSSLFTRAKDFLFNQSELWQISSFNISRSTALHILSTLGLLGLAAFGILTAALVRFVLRLPKENRFKKLLVLETAYMLLVVLLFPPSLIVFFLFFFLLALAAKEWFAKEPPQTHDGLTLSRIAPLYLIVAVILLAFVGFSSYFLGRAYASEYLFKQAQDAFIRRNARDLYQNQQKAIQMNPYVENYRINFAQTNLLIANSTVFQARQKQAKTQEGQEPEQLTLTEQERQTVTQAIQAAISEAKAAVVLNPQKGLNWENLAQIYRNILNVAQDANVWTISSYQRAILLDPRNPIYRLNLGGVFYALQNYKDAITAFEDAASLKPDWANAHYNLAWANYQSEDFQTAAQSMQTVIKLLENQGLKNSADYKKAQQELEEFKKQIPKESSGATEEGELKLPPQPEPEISPKLELPKDSSPEAE